jgi:S1-C subfamily serine protease
MSMRLSGKAVCAALGLVVLLWPNGSSVAQESPSKSVFLLVMMMQEGRRFHSVSTGTGFFISSDGTALTNSHVVYQARGKARLYSLLAIIGGEFYGANLVCAAELPVDPTRDERAVPSRDVAEIRLTPSRFPFDELTYHGIAYARSHRGPLPAFPFLRLGTDPAVGDAVRVLGFGRMDSPVPYEWSARGTVAALETARDGSPIFEMQFDRATLPGHSGSPVLNARDEVVGLDTWYRRTDTSWGGAIAASALEPACP